MRNWTMERIEALKKTGNITGYKEVTPKKKHEEPKGRIVSKHFSQKSKAKDDLAWTLLLWCNKRGYRLLEQYRFAYPRRFKFDYCIEEIMVGIEFDGGLHDRNGSHSSKKDIERDIVKTNLAQASGFTFLRYAAFNWNTVEEDLQKILDKK